jgi:hypothetical protein
MKYRIVKRIDHFGRPWRYALEEKFNWTYPWRVVRFYDITSGFEECMHDFRTLTEQGSKEGIEVVLERKTK